MNFREKSHVDPVNNYRAGSSHDSFAAGRIFRWNARADVRSFREAIARAGNSHVHTNTQNERGYWWAHTRFIASEKERRAHRRPPQREHAGCHGSIFALHAFIWSIIPNSVRYGVGRCCSWKLRPRDRDRCPTPRNPLLPRQPFSPHGAPARKCTDARTFQPPQYE